MDRRILIDAAQPEEVRVAVVEDGRLAEIHLAVDDRDRRQGDIYLGRVRRVETAVQAAFVDIGASRPGFLHVDDVMPLHAERPDDATAFESRPAGGPGPIESILRPGQRLLVQVVRDAVGTKGPTLTTYVSLPGRWLVLMPSLERVGVSRRIEDPEVREQVRATLEDLAPPEGLGVIVRTAGAGRSRDELETELDALVRLYRGLAQRCRAVEPPARLVRASSLVVRVLRDWLASDVAEVIVEGAEALAEARTLLDEGGADWSGRLRGHEGPEPLFLAQGIEDPLRRMLDRRVPLPGGGFLLIEPTEALVSIDVNSGRSTRGADLEETALETDLLAAAEIGRQLRLRDLGGLVVVDFIDVRRPENRAKVEAAVAEAFRDDRERVRFTPLSEFGLVEITRRRTGPSVRQVLHQGCPCCGGRGIVRTPPSEALRAWRDLLARVARHRKGSRPVELRAGAEVAAWLRKQRGSELADLEQEGRVRLVEDDGLHPWETA